MKWRSPGRPMSDAEAAELVRGLDNLELAGQLVVLDKAALAIITDDRDPRRNIATEVLGVIDRIRGHQRRGWDTSALVSRLRRLTQRGDELILQPFVEDGERVRAGRVRGHAVQAAGRDARITKWQARYTQLRQAGHHPKAARDRVAEESASTSLPVTRSWCRDNLREK